MGRAGKALSHVLATYGIAQNRLAVTMGIDRSTVHHWVKETKDPLANAIPDLVDALEKLNPAAAEEFLKLYLGRSTQKDAE